MTTTDKPPFDPIAAAADCMAYPDIAAVVWEYHNGEGDAHTVFQFVHDDFTLAQAQEITDVLCKRGKYAEVTNETPQELIGFGALLSTITAWGYSQVDPTYKPFAPDIETRVVWRECQEGVVKSYTLYGNPIIALADGNRICASLDDIKLLDESCVIEVIDPTPAIAPVLPEPLSRLAELEAENARLKAALQPFVDAARYLDGTDGDSEIFWVFHTNAASGAKLGLFIGDLRRAESAVKASAA